MTTESTRSLGRRRGMVLLVLIGLVGLYSCARYVQFSGCGVDFSTALQIRELSYSREHSPALASFYSTAGHFGENAGQQRWDAIYEILRNSLGGIVVDAGSDASALLFVLALGHDVHAMEPEPAHGRLLTSLACVNRHSKRLVLHEIAPSNVTSTVAGLRHDRIDSTIARVTKSMPNQFVRLLLLDGQANRPEVIDGAFGLLLDRKAEYVVLELAPCKFGNVQQLHALQEHGYDAFVLSSTATARFSSLIHLKWSGSDLVRKVEMGNLMRAALQPQALPRERLTEFNAALAADCAAADVLLHKHKLAPRSKAKVNKPGGKAFDFSKWTPSPHWKVR